MAKFQIFIQTRFYNFIYLIGVCVCVYLKVCQKDMSAPKTKSKFRFSRALYKEFFLFGEVKQDSIIHYIDHQIEIDSITFTSALITISQSFRLSANSEPN